MNSVRVLSGDGGRVVDELPGLRLDTQIDAAPDINVTLDGTLWRSIQGSHRLPTSQNIAPKRTW
jgi:hypothetical protein